MLGCLNPNQVLVLGSAGCEGLSWGGEVWDGVPVGWRMGASRSVLGRALGRAVRAAGVSCVGCSLESAWLGAKDLRGERSSSWVKCTETRKLIFNKTVEIEVSCITGGGGVGLCCFTPLVPAGAGRFEGGVLLRALALGPVFGGGTVQWFNTEYCLKRLQKQGFTKRYRGTLLKQQWGRQLFNWFLSKHLQFPFKAVKLIINMVDRVCFQSCCFVPPLFFF